LGKLPYSSYKEREEKEKEANKEVGFNRKRPVKTMTIKLSRYIEEELRNMETDKNDTKEFLASMKEE